MESPKFNQDPDSQQPKPIEPIRQSLLDRMIGKVVRIAEKLRSKPTTDSQLEPNHNVEDITQNNMFTLEPTKEIRPQTTTQAEPATIIPFPKQPRKTSPNQEQVLPEQLSKADKRRLRNQGKQTDSSTSLETETVISSEIELTPNELPWLTKAEKVQLDLRTDAEGTKYYFGNAIFGKELTSAFEHLLKQQKGKGESIINKLLEAHLPQFLNRRSDPDIRIVDGAVTNDKVYYVGNQDGTRVYFLRLAPIDGHPVIMRIAGCHKTQQMSVLKVLTDNSKKEIKQRGKL